MNAFVRGSTGSGFLAVSGRGIWSYVRFITCQWLATWWYRLMGRKIALVEDEPSLQVNYSGALERHGYEVSVYSNRKEAISAFELSLPELAIIDVGLGNEAEGGFELCRQLRGMAPLLPIVFLTALDSELDTISGLRLGADDYLTKDISLAHLVARVVALLRRVDAHNQPDAPEDIIKAGELQLDMKRMQALWCDEAITLSVTELWMVHALAQHPGHVKTRQQLMDAANVVLDDATITSHVKRIRRKFLAADKAFDRIETAYGMGYRWLA